MIIRRGRVFSGARYHHLLSKQRTGRLVTAELKRREP